MEAAYDHRAQNLMEQEGGGGMAGATEGWEVMFAMLRQIQEGHLRARTIKRYELAWTLLVLGNLSSPQRGWGGSIGRNLQESGGFKTKCAGPPP